MQVLVKSLLTVKNVTDRLPSERGLSMVFQSYALYPHMTVAENIGFSLKNSGVAKVKIASRVQQISHVLKLEKLLNVCQNNYLAANDNVLQLVVPSYASHGVSF